MTNLRKATDEELLAELERRRAGTPKPPPKIEPVDWSGVEKITDDYRAWCASDDYHEDHSWKQYVFEAAVTAVYGAAFWDWLRKVRA